MRELQSGIGSHSRPQYTPSQARSDAPNFDSGAHLSTNSFHNLRHVECTCMPRT